MGFQSLKCRCHVNEHVKRMISFLFLNENVVVLTTLVLFDESFKTIYKAESFVRRFF